MVTASTSMAGSDAHGLPDDHVYTILSYNENKGTILVRNPHGSGSDATGLKYKDNLNDGKFEMTLAEFYKYFSFIVYEKG